MTIYIIPYTLYYTPHTTRTMPEGRLAHLGAVGGIHRGHRRAPIHYRLELRIAVGVVVVSMVVLYNNENKI